MPQRTRRRRSYRSRPPRQARNYSLHKVISRGSTTLDPDNRVFTGSVLDTAESGPFYGKDLATRGNSVVALRGSWWWWSDAALEGAAVQTQGWLSMGFISMNQDVAQQSAGALNEQAQFGPLDLEGRYQAWHYRRTVPIINRAPGVGTSQMPTFDQAEQMLMTRQGIGVNRAEKFQGVRDRYYQMIQLDNAVDYGVGVAWQYQLLVREP